MSALEDTRGASSVATPTVLRLTRSGFRAVWHAGDDILDLCLCGAAFHHRPHQIFRGTAAGTWPGQDHAVWPAVFCDSLGRFWFRAFTILLTVLWIYLPMLLAAPTDVVALNYFFDTLLFSGAILLLANAMDKETLVARI